MHGIGKHDLPWMVFQTVMTFLNLEQIEIHLDPPYWLFPWSIIWLITERCQIYLPRCILTTNYGGYLILRLHVRQYILGLWDLRCALQWYRATLRSGSLYSAYVPCEPPKMINVGGDPYFSKCAMMHDASRWCTTHFGGAQCRSMVHNVALYCWTGAQRMPHKADRHIHRLDHSVTSTADTGRQLLQENHGN